MLRDDRDYPSLAPGIEYEPLDKRQLYAMLAEVVRNTGRRF
jgi:hypothetical protein